MSRRVVIAGGGFSGAATAAALLRRREPGLHVTLVERSGVFGRGVAYGTSAAPSTCSTSPRAR